MGRLTLRLLILIMGLAAPAAWAQSAEQIARAQAFFATHDISGDGFLTQQEFVEGFIAQSRSDDPLRTAAALLAYGRDRIEGCLGLAFETADANTNGLLALEELGEAYRQDAFSDLREIC